MDKDIETLREDIGKPGPGWSHAEATSYLTRVIARILVLILLELRKSWR